MLAHQGGWDEVFLVVAPIAVLALVLVLANRRAAAPPDAVPGRDTTDDVGA